MSIQRQMTAIGTVGVVIGLAIVFLPGQSLGLLGLALESGGAVSARFLGGSTLAWGVLALTARGVPGRAGLGAIAGGLFVGALAGAVLAVWGTTSGALNTWGWMLTGLLALLTLLMGTYRFTGRGS